MNHLCETVCPLASISSRLAVGQQYGLTSDAVSTSVQWFLAGVFRLGSFSAPSTSRHQVVPLVKRGVPPPTPNLAPPGITSSPYSFSPSNVHTFHSSFPGPVWTTSSCG